MKWYKKKSMKTELVDQKWHKFRSEVTKIEKNWKHINRVAQKTKHIDKKKIHYWFWSISFTVPVYSSIHYSHIPSVRILNWTFFCLSVCYPSASTIKYIDTGSFPICISLSKTTFPSVYVNEWRTPTWSI